MCEQKPKFYLWRDLSQPRDELHLFDGVAPAQGTFLGQAETDTDTANTNLCMCIIRCFLVWQVCSYGCSTYPHRSKTLYNKTGIWIILII